MFFTLYLHFKPVFFKKDDKNFMTKSFYEIRITKTWIEILDESFPEEALYSYKTVKTFGWDFDFDFEIIAISPGQFHIKVFIDYWLDSVNENNKGTPVLSISTCTNFTIEGTEVDTEGKLELLHKLFPIAYWNLQGVYIAKTQGTGYVDAIPPMIDFENYTDETLHKIINDWK
jgi:hypothetical protein